MRGTVDKRIKLKLLRQFFDCNVLVGGFGLAAAVDLYAN
jgi:hypothetical protein